MPKKDHLQSPTDSKIWPVQKREYPTLQGKDAEVFLERQEEHKAKAKKKAENYMNTLFRKYGRGK